jgi:myo-inositol-1-phosphate synthase
MSDQRPLGVWMVGARGAVATTTVVGAAALRRGMLEPIGMVTEAEPLRGLPLAGLDTLTFGGHDVSLRPLPETAFALTGEGGPLRRELVCAVEEDLRPVDSRLRAAPERPTSGPLRPFVRQVQEDLESFADDIGARRTVMMNLATTEPDVWADPMHADPVRLEEALDASMPPPESILPTSTLYAYAALQAHVPYVNFTPSVGAALPALEALAMERGIPLAGRDGKTGETLLKSALAPMFKMRELKVKSWIGFNVLGNGDGAALRDPGRSAHKSESKARVVPGILGYEPFSLVRIDYAPTLGDWKTAWDMIQFEGFLGTPMTLQLTWQGCDSALAAPLVLDLVRLVDLAAERGDRGPLAHLAFFFKSPLACDVHDLSGQYDLLCEHVLCG